MDSFLCGYKDINDMIKKSLLVLLVIVGIILIGYPYIADFVLKVISDTHAEDLHQLTESELDENQKREANFNFNSVDEVTLTRTLVGSQKFDKKSIIGQLIISDINLNLSIVKGVSEFNLLVGAATMKKDQIMGKGNYSLGGHYIKRKDTLFGGLMDIKKGSIIQVTDKKMVYEYIVYDIQVVKDTNTLMIDDEKAIERGKPIISLMTCYYSSKTGKRFFVLGELEKEYPYDDLFHQKVKNSIP